MTAETGKWNWASRRLHFIGIGGAGMSGLALVCHGLGATVTGSDCADSSYMERLRAAGLEPVVGHDASNLPEGEVDVVRSTAIPVGNPEWKKAVGEGMRVLHRGELLAELCAGRRLIAVAGTHGKTTTAAMVAWALRALGADPAFFVGGEVPGLGPDGGVANAGWGGGEWVVAEADESDASFLELKPEVAVVTNVEMDHHSRWGSLGELRQAFGKFLEPARAVVLPAGGEGLARLAPEQRDDVSGVGGRISGEGAPVPGKPADREMTRTIGFRVDAPGPPELALRVPGRHNMLNARAAIAAVEAAFGGSRSEPASANGPGEEVGRAAGALADFPGVRRRLEFKGRRGGARIYDDYAHHPTEVRAALSALREQGPERLIAVFQPHLYSRTRAFAEQFGAALALADEVAVLDVYPAREEPVGELAGVSGLDVARAAADRMGGRRVAWTPTLDQARAAVEPRLGPGRVLVTIGAGDVFRVAEALVGEGPRGARLVEEEPRGATTVRGIPAGSGGEAKGEDRS